jgi:hypothetical protein
MCIDWIDGRTDYTIFQRPLTILSHPRLAPNRHDEVLESNQAATVSFARDAKDEPSNAVETAIIAHSPPLQPPISHLPACILDSLLEIPIHDPTHCQMSRYLSVHPPIPHFYYYLLIIPFHETLINAHPSPRSSRQPPIIILALSTLMIIPQPHQFHPPNDGMPSWMFGVASGVDCLNSAGGSCKALVRSGSRAWSSEPRHDNTPHLHVTTTCNNTH